MQTGSATRAEGGQGAQCPSCRRRKWKKLHVLPRFRPFAREKIPLPCLATPFSPLFVPLRKWCLGVVLGDLSLHQFSHSMFNSPTLSPFECRFFFVPTSTETPIQHPANRIKFAGNSIKPTAQPQGRPHRKCYCFYGSVHSTFAHSVVFS